MSNGTIVLDSQPSDDGRILHRNGKEPGEDSFYGGSFVMKLFESFGSVVDLFADARGQTDGDITSFLGDEFGVSGGAEEVALPLFSEMNGTAIHKVSDACSVMGSFSFPVHREIGLAVNGLSFKGIRSRCGFTSGVTRDNSSGFEVLNNETEDVFRVIDGVCSHGFDDEGESFFCFSEHGDGLRDFTNIGRMSDFPNRDFLWGIGHDVVSTQDLGKDSALDPEVFELAQLHGRVVLTKNTEDYFDLHEKHKDKGHFGVLAIYEHADPDRDMSYKDVVQALANIEGAGVVLANSFQSLNAWNWTPAPRPSGSCER